MERIMEKRLAKCGLICTDCEAFIATQTGNPAKLQRVAKEWSERYNYQFTAEALVCDGCLTTSGKLASFCRECLVRLCAFDKELENCAYCEDYVCENLAKCFQMAPEAKQRLDEIRSGI